MAEFKLTFEDGSDGYLAHHGIKGMKWGVWNEDTRARRMGGKGEQKSIKKSDNDTTSSAYKYHQNLANKVIKNTLEDPSVKKEASDVLKSWFVAGNMVDDKEYCQFMTNRLISDIIDERVRFSPEGKKISDYEDILDGQEVITPMLRNYGKSIDSIADEVYRDFMNTKY